MTKGFEEPCWNGGGPCDWMWMDDGGWNDIDNEPSEDLICHRCWRNREWDKRDYLDYWFLALDWFRGKYKDGQAAIPKQDDRDPQPV